MSFPAGYSSLSSSRLDREIVARLKLEALSFSSIEEAPFAGLADRIGQARLVLLGEATHGTAEFYQMRAAVTKYLIQNHGFNIIALEADWPDAAQVNRYIRHQPISPSVKAFSHFPIWMWRNAEFHQFAKWLHAYHASLEAKERMVNVYGLDLYSLYSSIEEVLRYLDREDPQLASQARDNYSCLMPWKGCPSEYGSTVSSERHKDCQEEVLTVLNSLFEKQLESNKADDEGFLDMFLNANLIVNAERYYRSMYDSFRSSWNIRDQHMFETLEYLLSFKGKDAKAVVWAHNSHLGNAAATEMGLRGEFNLGQLCREAYQANCYSIGFGTHQGTVAAATDWGGKVKIEKLLPSRKDSYESLFHQAGLAACLLPMRQDGQKEVREMLLAQRLERAVGVVYRPDTEFFSHYFLASLPMQFDEYVWFDTTKAVTPLAPPFTSQGIPDTYPFGL